MSEAFIIGVCIIAVVLALIFGSWSMRLVIAGAVVVGWAVNNAQGLASGGVGLLDQGGDLIARLGGGTIVVDLIGGWPL